MALSSRLLSLLVLLTAATGTLLVAPVFTPAAAAARPVAPVLVDSPVDGATRLDDSPRAAREVFTPNALLAQLRSREVKSFNTLGVTWSAAQSSAPLSIMVSVRSKGRWSDWTRASVADLRPDKAVSRLGTEPLWVGQADAFSIEIRRAGPGAAPTGLTVTTIDPGTSPADAAAARKAPASSAAASALHPNWVTRAQWGADERLMNWDHEYSPTVRAVFVHHTTDRNNYSRADAPKLIRAIYAYHAKSLDWGDIGYNYVVDKYGTVYEGRSGGLDSAVVGGHTYGFNSSTSGIALLGNFSNTAPTSAMVAALERLLAWKLSKYYRNPQSTQALVAGESQRSGTGRSFVAGQSYAFNVISGHRDGFRTDCPGNGVYSRLSQIRTDVARLMGARLYDPVATPVAGTTTLPGGIKLTSSMGGTLNWTMTVKDASNNSLLASYQGRNTGSMSQTWSLKVGGTNLVLPGKYTVTLSANDGQTTALPASFTLTLGNDGGGQLYPAGTWLKSGSQYWRMDQLGNGRLVRRPVLASAIQTYANIGQAITPPKNILDAIPTGQLLGWAEGSLVAPDSSSRPYLVSGGQLRLIEQDPGLGFYGYSSDWILHVPPAEIAKIARASNLSGTNHPAGTYISDNGRTYQILKGPAGALYRRAFVSDTALQTWVNPAFVVPANDADRTLYLDSYQRGVADGSLITVDRGQQLFVVSFGKARPISDEVANAMGYRNPRSVSLTDLGHENLGTIELGTVIADHEDVVRATATSPNSVTKVVAWTSYFLGTPVETASRHPQPPLP